jgi:hypothetical protein
MKGNLGGIRMQEKKEGGIYGLYDGVAYKANVCTGHIKAILAQWRRYNVLKRHCVYINSRRGLPAR